MLKISGAPGDIALAEQQTAMLVQLSNIGMINSYYDVTIAGGVYKESLKFEDKDIQDNKKALKTLTQQETHRSLVRSQYD